MKAKTRYIVYVIIILILSSLIPGMLTNSKYFYNVNLENDVTIGNMIFNIKQKENETETYEIQENEEIVAKYELKNYDEDNNINEVNLKYYIKIVDSLNNETLPLEISIDGYSYIEYNIDEDGNIINSDGDITDEFGNVIEVQDLKEGENEVLQKSLQNVKKGYGPIALAYDGVTTDTKDINIRIRCPENCLGDENLQYKIVVIAEGNNINAQNITGLKLKIVREENIEFQEETQGNIQQDQNNEEEQNLEVTQNNLQDEIEENQEDLENENTINNNL